MNKIKISSIVFFSLISFIVQIISVIILGDVDPNIYCIFSVSSVFPFCIALLMASTFFSGKVKFLKYIFLGYASFMLVLAIVVIIIALTSGFTMIGQGTFVAA